MDTLNLKVYDKRETFNPSLKMIQSYTAINVFDLT